MYHDSNFGRETKNGKPACVLMMPAAVALACMPTMRPVMRSVCMIPWNVEDMIGDKGVRFKLADFW